MRQIRQTETVKYRWVHPTNASIKMDRPKVYVCVLKRLSCTVYTAIEITVIFMSVSLILLGSSLLVSVDNPLFAISKGVDIRQPRGSSYTSLFIVLETHCERIFYSNTALLD